MSSGLLCVWNRDLKGETNVWDRETIVRIPKKYHIVFIVC